MIGLEFLRYDSELEQFEVRLGLAGGPGDVFWIGCAAIEYLLRGAGEIPPEPEDLVGEFLSLKIDESAFAEAYRQSHLH